MISRKYIKDYIIDEQIGANGRVRSQAVYIGAGYTVTPLISMGTKRVLTGLSAISSISYICAMLPVTLTARAVYILLPFAVSALPICLMLMSSVSLLRAREIMERSEAEKITNRLPQCSLISTILTAASITGLIVNSAILRTGIIGGDIIFGTFALACTVATATVFGKCRKMKAMVIE